MVSADLVIQKGTIAQTERWPFASLKRGSYFQVDDLSLHTAVRSAATRAKRRYPQKNFSVRKVTVMKNGAPQRVLRVYRIPRRGYMVDSEP